MWLWSSWLELAAFEGPASQGRRHVWERSFPFPLPLLLLRPERAEEAELDGEGSLFVSSGGALVCCDELPTFRGAVVGGTVAGGTVACFLGAMIVVEFG